jgi:hypothetical protein
LGVAHCEAPLREYRFQATTDSIEALRTLRGAWRGLAAADHEITIVMQDGRAVRIAVDEADVEGLFDAYRLRAEIETSPGVFGVPQPAFADGNNDIVLFTGVTWSEPHGAIKAEGVSETSVMHFSGHPGQLSETAEVVCVTTDAVVVASAGGTGVLIRTGLRPGTVQVEHNPEKVRAFLLERGYNTEG